MMNFGNFPFSVRLSSDTVWLSSTPLLPHTVEEKPLLALLAHSQWEREREALKGSKEIQSAYGTLGCHLGLAVA